MKFVASINSVAALQAKRLVKDDVPTAAQNLV